jgi:hypothetical protein
MFDCDGDRREFAKNQTKNFLARGKNMVLGNGSARSGSGSEAAEKK